VGARSARRGGGGRRGSILILGEHVDAIWDEATVIAAFVGGVALWATCFNWDAETDRLAITQTGDPGRGGVLAFSYFHIPILAGIVVTAAADVLTISQPTAGTTLTSAAVIIGGPALFLAASASGWALDGKRPTHRLAALCALAALAAAADFASQLSLLIAATAIVLGSPSGTGWR
jgi:low temperature requirement protein LtrA